MPKLCNIIVAAHLVETRSKKNFAAVGCRQGDNFSFAAQTFQVSGVPGILDCSVIACNTQGIGEEKAQEGGAVLHTCRKAETDTRGGA